MNFLRHPWLRSLLPSAGLVSQGERFRAGTGALLGIFLTGCLSAALLGDTAAAVTLIAPMGASAVLLFGVPASPLAQPWAITGGNLASAFIGVSCAKLIGSPFQAAALAIFLSIGAMFALRCLHPPSGAVALTAVLGGPAVHASGYEFVLSPVGLNTVVLLLVAFLYNNMTGRRYPHTQQLELVHPHLTNDVVPMSRLGFTPGDLQAVLKEYNQVLDVSADDLADLFSKTEMHALRRVIGDTRCVDIMSKDIVTVEFGTELQEAWALMDSHRLQALPVVNRVRHVVGIVTRTDFLRHAQLTDATGIQSRMRALLRRTPHTHSSKPEVVGQIMSSPAKTVADSTPIVELVPLMSDVGLHHVPVVDAQRKLVGMVTQTDLIAALYETNLAKLSEARVLPSSI